MSILSFSGKYEILDDYQNCESGKEVTTEEECRDLATDFEPELYTGPFINGIDNRWGLTSFVQNWAWALPYCYAFPWEADPRNPLKARFNYAKVTYPDADGVRWARPICHANATNPGKSSFR